MEADLPRPFYDLIPNWLVIGGTIVVLMLASEIGFQLARRRKRAPDAEEKSHAGVLLAALLALLGLLLAFSFSIVEGLTAGDRLAEIVDTGSSRSPVATRSFNALQPSSPLKESRDRRHRVSRRGMGSSHHSPGVICREVRY